MLKIPAPMQLESLHFKLSQDKLVLVHELADFANLVNRQERGHRRI